MRDKIIRNDNPNLSLDDSIKIKDKLKSINHNEITNVEVIEDINVKKFSFSISDRKQIDSIGGYLNNLVEAIKANTSSTYNYKQLDPSNEYYDSFSNSLVGLHDGLYYSFNILAGYDKGKSQMKLSAKATKAIFQETNDMTDEEYKATENERQERIANKAKYIHVEPMLTDYFIEIYLFWK